VTMRPDGQWKRMPKPLKLLIGRQSEVDHLCLLLAHSDVRLLTIVGTGGVGKTQIALQVAYDLQSAFPDGVYSIFLDSIIDPDLVLPTLLHKLGANEIGPHADIETLLPLLHAKRLLLLLDNFEHLIVSAPLSPRLLDACPAMKILVTSRAGLHVRGEQQFPLSPLNPPEHADGYNLSILAQNPAVALFLTCTRVYHPSFQLTSENASAIAHICTHLEGLPLAIELAATAGMQLFSPQTLLKHLEEHPLQILTNEKRDVSERQRTLRKTIDWSYSLLNEHEQRLFWRLSVFADGATLEALEALYTKLDDENHEVLHSIRPLVNHHLILSPSEDLTSTSHFRMLRVICAYGQERLKAAGETETVERAYITYFCDLVKEIEPKLSGPAQLQELELLQQEQNNLRAVFMWLMEHKEIEQVLHFTTALWKFRLYRGSVPEGLRQIERALEACQKRKVPAKVQAKGQYAASILAYFQGDAASARTHIEFCLRLYQEIGERHGYAIALNTLGYCELLAGNYEAVQACYEESFPILQEVGDRWHQAEVLGLIAGKAQAQGEYLQAQNLYEQSIAISREVGDRRALIQGLGFLGQLVRHINDYEAALRLAQEKSEVAIELGGKPLIASCLGELSEIAIMRGQAAWAAILGGAEEVLRETSRELTSTTEQKRLEHLAFSVRTQLGEENGTALWNQGRAMTPQQALLAEPLISLEQASHVVDAPAFKAPPRSSRYSNELTTREMEILCLVAQDLSDKQIAARLSISPRTINTHLHKIYQKIQVHSRSGATRYALEHKLI